MSVFRYQTQKSWLLSPFWLRSKRPIMYNVPVGYWPTLVVVPL